MADQDPTPPDVAAEEPVVAQPTRASDSEPVVATDDPAGATFAAPAAVPTETGPVAAAEDATDAGTRSAAPRVVYVEAPVAPKPKGNRGIGSLIAILSGLVYAVLYAAVALLLILASTGAAPLAFLARPTFYVPVIFFIIGFVVLVLLVNRAGWMAYVLGSLFVALFVYFASIGTLLLLENIVSRTAEDASVLFRSALTSPAILVAALIAREVALWTGALIAARGRRVKAKNQDALERFERESAEKRAEYDFDAWGPPAKEPDRTSVV